MENKFKVGQKVVLTNVSDDVFDVNVGDIGKIIDIDCDDFNLPYNIKFNSDNSQWVEEESLKLVEDDNVDEYIGSDKENEFLYTGGETVIVKNSGNTYTTYDKLAKKMKLTNWNKGELPENGDVGIVVAYLPHGDPNYDQIVGVDIDGQQYMIGIKGVEKIEYDDEHDYETDSRKYDFDIEDEDDEEEDMEECHKYVCQYYENRELVLFDEEPDENEFKILNVVKYYK